MPLPSAPTSIKLLTARTQRLISCSICLFPTDTGKPVARQLCHYLFRRYAAKAGIDVRAFPHMARATMITSAYEAGASGEAIQRTVGHSSITTTEGYNHTVQKHRESASLKIGY